MSLEAAAGKNPLTHIGKIYNVVAREIAEMLVGNVPEITAVQCLMVSRIGQPLTNPALLQAKLATREGFPAVELKGRTDEIVTHSLNRLPMLVGRLRDWRNRDFLISTLVRDTAGTTSMLVGSAH